MVSASGLYGCSACAEKSERTRPPNTSVGGGYVLKPGGPLFCFKLSGSCAETQRDAFSKAPQLGWFCIGLH